MLEDDYSTKYQGFDPSDPESYIFMMLMQNSHREQSLRFAEEVQTKLAGGPIKNDRGVSQDPLLRALEDFDARSAGGARLHLQLD